MEHRLQSTKFLLIALLVLGALRLLWPGDTLFLNDEPNLIRIAFESNAQNVWPRFGIRGTRGMDYGPFAVWWYKIGLTLTQNPIALVALKVAFVTLLTILAILWLNRTCSFLIPGIGALALLSPYLWIYSRDLWDNTFLIPLTAVTFASYVAFLKEKRTWQLFIVALFGSLAFSTHLMSIALLVPIALHLLVSQHRWVLNHLLTVLILGIVFLLVNYPYLTHFVPNYRPNPLSFGILASFLFPFYSARLFSDVGFQYFLGKNWFLFMDPWALNVVFVLCFILSALAYLFFWSGLYLSAKQLFTAEWRKKNSHTFQVHSFAWAVFITHICLCFFQRLYSHPHYYNATWMVTFYFLWFGVSALIHRRWAIRTFSAYAGALTVMFVAIVLSIHWNGGSRAPRYGATLRNQMEVAKQIHKYDPASPIEAQSNHYLHFGNSIHTLRIFLKKDAGILPKKRLVVRYREPTNLRSGFIELVEKN